MVKFRVLWLLIGGLLLTGLIFPPLMDNDAAEYASIALRMHQESDYLNIINRDYDYLDKPHLLFWSAAAGYKIFGVSHEGYRIFSILMSLLGAYATFRLGALLYNDTVGRISAVLFMTSQAIILANHDVRTDSLLTSLIIIGVWNFMAFIKHDKLLYMIGGAAALALGVATKGMIAVLVAGCVIFFYLAFTSEWKRLATLKWGVGLITFIVVLSPFLISYYYQFDLHPEKFVNGQYRVSGIRFLLWDQSFERFAGDRNFKNNAEFFFFHHTFLWAFLPWSFIALLAFVKRIRDIFRKGFCALVDQEQLTFLGTFVMFTVMSLSSFKLPHYINVLFPMIAIATAAYLYEIRMDPKIVRRLIVLQLVVNVLILILIVFLNSWAFPVSEVWIIVASLALFALFIYSCRTTDPQDPLYKVWVPSSLAIIIVNFLMNTNFYPAISQYQAGSTLAAMAKERGLSHDEIYVATDRYRSFDFYSGSIHDKLSMEEINDKVRAGEPFYLVARHDDMTTLDNEHIEYQTLLKAPDYRITMVKGKFLNPASRDSSYKYAYIVKVGPAQFKGHAE